MQETHLCPSSLVTERAASPGKGGRVRGGHVGPSRASAWKVGVSFLLDPDASPTRDLLAWAAPRTVGWPGWDRGGVGAA